MSSWPNLTRSPVVEAVIDLRVAPLPAVNVSRLIDLAETFAAAFPRRQIRSRTHAEVRFAPSAPTVSSSESHDGVVMHSVDGCWVVQMHLGGVTVSRLQPYGQWSELRAEAKRWWSEYCRVLGPQSVVRAGTRFINRIPLRNGESLDRTFVTTFVLGPTLPQSVAGCLLRCVVPFEAEKAISVITQSIEGGEECLFDIDVFAEHPEGLDESGLWPRLEQLREMKNQVFFGSLSQQAVESMR